MLRNGASKILGSVARFQAVKGVVSANQQIARYAGRFARFAPISPVRSLSTTTPPFVEIPMPKLVPTMEDGVLSKWYVGEGDELQAGDLLCEVDVYGLNEDHKTDTLTLLIESHEVGYIARLLVKEGSTVRVDHPIGVMVEDEDAITALKDYTPPDGPSRNSGSDAAAVDDVDVEEDDDDDAADVDDDDVDDTADVEEDDVGENNTAGAGADVKTEDGRLFCWQAYLKED